MATMRTNLTGTETTGEKKLYYIFRDKFHDDYHVWHNVHIHAKSTEIDFVVVHPSEGIYIIEVKDLVLHNISGFHQDRIQYHSAGSTQLILNPITQARNNSFIIRNGLEHFPCMINQSGVHKNKLITPVNFGAALPNISSTAIVNSGFENQLPANKILDKSFFDGIAFSNRDFEKSLQMLDSTKFNTLLEQDQWVAISKLLGTPVITDPISNEEIGVVDEVQESLISFNINAQLLVEGPAGSGKSVILLKRAAYMLEQNPDWKIGVFCYNTLMANYLTTLASSENLPDRLNISSFGSISISSRNRHTYDAVLIDEGQDLKAKHLEKVRHLLNPSSNALTIFYDPNQAIYSRDDLEHLLLSNGFNIDFEKKLVKQQRSVHFALALAYYNATTNRDQPFETSLKESYALLERYFSGFNNPVAAIAAGTARHFSNNSADCSPNIFRTELEDKVQLMQFNYVKQMIHHFAETIKELCSHSGAKFSDFMIIYPWAVVGKQPISKYAAEVLQSHELPYRILASKSAEYFNVDQQLIYDEKNNLSSASLTDNVVRVSNIYQSKGQDAKYVAIIGFENIIKIPSDQSKLLTENQVIQQAAARAYVLITRATSKLYIYYSENTTETKLLSNILQNI